MERIIKFYIGTSVIILTVGLFISNYILFIVFFTFLIYLLYELSQLKNSSVNESIDNIQNLMTDTSYLTFESLDYVDYQLPEITKLNKSLFKKMLENMPKKGLYLPLGVDESQKNIYIDFTNKNGIVLYGTTKSGKSVCIDSFITTLLVKQKPNECFFAFYDPKKIELIEYKNIPHILFETNPLTFFLERIKNEVSRRNELLIINNAKTIEKYNTSSNKKMPYLFIFIEEITEYLNEYDLKLLTDIINNPVDTGIKIIITSNNPKIINYSETWEKISRLCFKVTEEIHSENFIKIKDAKNLNGNGEFYYQEDNKKPIKIKGVNITDSEINNIVNQILIQGNIPKRKK